MKHYLLSLMALTTAMFTSASAWAQTELPDPVRPKQPVREAFNEGTWASTLEAEKQYYFYNVGAAQFMGTGRDYGTRTITTNDSIVSPAATQNTKHATNKGFVHPYSVAAIGENGYFTFSPIKTDMSGYVTGEGNASWQDGNGDRVGQWQIVPVSDVENGFLLHCANAFEYKPYIEDNPETDEDESAAVTIDEYRLLGVCAVEQNSYTWNDLRVGGFNTAGESHKVVWKFIEATDEVAVSIRQWREATNAALEEATKAYEAELAFYNAKLALKATIAQAEEASIDATEVTKAINIYNSAEATLEQAQQQNNHLQALLAGQKYNDISEFQDASEDNPQDVTEYVLVNPTFDSNINGWTITVGGQNLQWQARTDGKIDESKNWVTITNFIEAWTPSTGGLGDGTISQTIYGLPKGKYVLECDAMATRQGGLNGKSAEEAVEGTYIFIQGAESEVRTPIKAPDTQPKHWSVVFISEGDDALTFGLKVESTTANWISADNFKLTYYGATTKTQAQLELEAAVQEVEELYNGVDDLFCNKDVKSAFETAFTTASDLVSDGGSDVDCLAAKQALEEKTAAVNSSVEAYKVLLNYLDRTGGKALLDKYYNIADDCGMTELTTKWGDWKDNWDAAYEDGTMTDEEIYEKTASIYPDLKAAWLNVNVEDVQVGTDLTWLIENADFEEGNYFAGWDAADDNPASYDKYGTIPGWTISSGNITQMNHVIETYHRKFDFNQTIPNMPKGAYDVTVQGFVRHDGTPTDETIFYAGDSKSTLMLRSAQWNENGFYHDSAEQGDPCGGANTDETITNSNSESVKVPNGMSGFYFWEDEENTGGETMDYANWKPGDKYYTNHIKVILREDGDLKIGMMSLGTTDWIIWDNFGLAYLGQDASIYDEMVQDKLKELDKVCDPYKIIITSGGQQKVDDLKAEIETKKGTLNADTEAEYEDKIDALINYLNEGHKLAISLRDDLSDYDDIRLANQELFSDDENGFVSWVSGLIDLFPYEDYGLLRAEDDIDDEYKGTINNNEALQATTIDMNRRMADYVMQFAAANPFNENDGTYYGNATEAIFNPRFISYADVSQQTSKGWTMEVADSIKGKAIGLGGNVAEVFNSSNFVISQTLRGLYPGWYLLTVDGFYRPGRPQVVDTKNVFTAEDAQKQYVEMFAESGAQQSSHPLLNIMAGAQAMPIATGDINVTIGEEELYIPDNMTSAATYLQTPVEGVEIPNVIAVTTDDNQEFSYNSIYRNGMLVQVDESGEMTFGLRKADHWVPNDWTIFGNWTLTYFGDEEKIPTAVETVEAKSAKNMIQDIFTIDGRQAQRLQRGINIVRTSDGKIHKVLVK